MLVIGIKNNGATIVSRVLDVDVDQDSPRKIHDLLAKETKLITFDTVICIEDDKVVGTWQDQEDYDLSLKEEEDLDINDEEDDTSFMIEEDNEGSFSSEED